MAPLRLGLIGCGRIAERGYLPAIDATPSVELVAVADPREGAARALASRLPNEHGVRTYADAAALVETAPIDAVVVATPAADHLAAARLAAAAGLAALVEKPPAPDLARAVELAGLDPAPWIGFNRRFQQGRELRGAVPAEGRLDILLELRYRRAAWRAVAARDDALLDLAPHLVDLALTLTGPGPVEVRRARCRPERAELELETARGPALIRCATDRAHRERAVVRTRDRRRLTASSGGVARRVAARLARRPHPLVGSLSLQLDAFAAAARGGDPGSLASAEDGVRTMRVIDAARLAAR